ncbi:hypothetical protein [Bacillus rhizoplanae]|uniref:hypothetical protein n=1 Tax=Bacillus rhizoplanae TaxID=2880966 RepID=UPI003D2225C6
MVQTVQKSDVITCWEENNYVIIAADKGIEQSTLMNRITKNLTKVLQDDIVHITFIFGGATYPLEGELFEALLELAQKRLYQQRDIQQMKL